MTDAQAYIQRLEDAEPLRAPVLRAVIEALRLPPGGRGLDVGSGLGRQAQMLAGAVGRVTGLDLSLDLLGYAGALARQTGVAGRVFFCQGDMRRLPFDDDAFDWAWSADCAGYPAGDLLPALGEMRRVVRPGGLVALLGWTSQQLLPGYALLEARLNATCSAYAPFLRDWGPEAHFMRAPDAFRRAGIAAPLARTFLGEAQAPLSPAVRRALTSLFDMLWGVRQPETSDADWSDYQRLCRPESPEFILDQRDYYAFFTCTLFCGLK